VFSLSVGSRQFYGALQEMAEWPRAEEITHVAMEATGIYWRPVFHALAEAEGLEIVLCNAHHVKNVPGRKADATDAVWLAQLCEVDCCAAALSRRRISPRSDS
jgi:transposase